MKALAEGLEQLGGFPPDLVNCYLMGGVLVDARTRFDGRGILKELKGRDVIAHALTHAHPDHQGSSRQVCEALGIPLWCGEPDAEAAEDPRVMIGRMRPSWINSLIGRNIGGPGHPVARRLREGDEVGGFEVVASPGHTAGHVSYWRQADRVLVVGDCIASVNPFTLRPGLRMPPEVFTPDPALNRESARKLGALEPSLICFGHGPPMRDTRKFVEFCEGLPV